MGSLLVAYLLGWLAVTLYATWLGIQNGRLTRRLDEVETLHQQQHVGHDRRKAA